MAQGYQQLKFERNPCKGSEITATQTDGQRTEFYTMSSADTVNQL